MYDAKNVIIVALSSLCVLLFVTTVGFYFSPKEKVSTEDKIVYIERPIKTEDIQDRLLSFGVSNAWAETYGTNIKADCFTTELVNGRSLYTYCELRKPLK